MLISSCCRCRLRDVEVEEPDLLQPPLESSDCRPSGNGALMPHHISGARLAESRASEDNLGEGLGGVFDCID